MSRTHAGGGITRRGAVVTLSGLAAGLAMARPALGAANETAEVVETIDGKVAGRRRGEVVVFEGIRYGASTGRANRFRPPQPVRPWSGVRDCVGFGASAPQARDVADGVRTDEDCLFLNVWTPGLRAARRPVMVWLHGGGWSEGSGSSPLTDGTHLAALGDVVIVTVNHRLNLFGFLRVDADDERFADAGNAGVLDMVAALRWVRDNIAGFGGDPSNVTIFGESGGGSKVSALMAAPAAAGFFHKAIAQSCSGSLRITPPDEAEALSHGVARRLGLDRPTASALQGIPMRQLAALATSAFRPVIDGRTFSRHPFDPDAPPTARRIPFLAGNMATETTHHLAVDPANFTLDAAEVSMRLERFLPATPERVREIVRAYAADEPGASPSRLLQRITSDFMYVRNTRREITLQAAAGAPTWAYLFAWPTPVQNGLLGSPHAMDVPFVFGTTARAADLVGTGRELEGLSRMMIATWSAFARTGDPNNATLPVWRRFDVATGATMVLDLASREQADPGGRARAALDGLPFYEYSIPISFTRHGAIPPGQSM